MRRPPATGRFGSTWKRNFTTVAVGSISVDAGPCSRSAIGSFATPRSKGDPLPSNRIEDLPDYLLDNYRADAMRRHGPGSGAVKVIDAEIARRKDRPPVTALSIPGNRFEELEAVERAPLAPFVPDKTGPVVGWLGLDPGLYSGAIGLIVSTGDVISIANNESGERQSIIDPRQHEFLAGLGFPVVAFVEQMTPIMFRKNKETGEKERVSPDSSLMRSAGAFQCALECYRIPYRTVRASTWQGLMGCRSGGKKIVTRDRARALYGDRHRGPITHRNADALLMADCCRRIMLGELEVKSWGKHKVLEPWRIT